MSLVAHTAAADSAQQNHSSSTIEDHHAVYHPSVWEDYFLSYGSDHKMDSDDKSEQIQQLKDVVKRMISVAAAEKEPVELLTLIDCIQRLGISYHFVEDIDDALLRISKMNCCESTEPDGSCTVMDLHATALMFRLLRRKGYMIPSSIFDKFRSPDGNFHDYLKTDMKGLLSLYEATHLRVHGEEILEEALTFTLTHIAAIDRMMVSPPSVREEMNRALKHYTIRRGFERLEAYHFIKFYGEDPSHHDVLLKLAKLDFNRLQKLHQHELGDITRWWKSLDVKKNFPYVRDRISECYFWSLVAYEAKHSCFRSVFTKMMGIITIIDDTFDVYGKFEDLELFAHAVERWDMEVMAELPYYMQVCYEALLNIYVEAKQMSCNGDNSYAVLYGIESMKILVRAYFEEAKWQHQRYSPTLEEYLKVGVLSGGGLLLFATAFLGMPDIVCKDDFKWLFSNPKMVEASKTVMRVMNDIMTHEFEQKIGQVPSAVECYMKKYGVSVEEAKNQLWKKIIHAWKDVNEELFCPTKVIPPVLLSLIFNITHMLDVWYEENDSYTHSNTKMKNYITCLLVNPLTMDA